jgi:hypothetical protein
VYRCKAIPTRNRRRQFVDDPRSLGESREHVDAAALRQRVAEMLWINHVLTVDENGQAAPEHASFVENAVAQLRVPLENQRQRAAYGRCP